MTEPTFIIFIDYVQKSLLYKTVFRSLDIKAFKAKTVKEDLDHKEKPEFNVSHSGFIV